MANEVVINVNANTAKAKAGFKDLKGRMEDFSKKARTAGMALSAFGAVGVLAIKGFVGAAMEQERAIKTLASSVESTGVSFDTVKAKIMSTTSALQDKTNFGDEAQIRVLTTLTTILGDVDQAMAALPAVMDASAASGMKMESVAKTMGKALSGQVNQADSVGIKFDETAGFADRLAQVLAKVGGAAEADVDPFQQLNNDMGDLKETIGAALIPILTPLVEFLRDIFKRLQDMNPAIVKAGAVALALGTAFGLVVGPALLLITLAPAIGAAFAIMMGPVGLVVLAIAALVAGIIGLAVAWNKNLGGIQEKTQAVFGFIKGLYESKFGWLLPGGPLIKALLFLKDNWGAIWGGMKDFFLSIWNKILEGIDTAVNFVVEKLNLLIDGLNAINPFEKIPHIDEMASALMDLSAAVRDNISDFIKLGTGAKIVTDNIGDDFDEVGDSIAHAAEQIDKALAPAIGGLAGPAIGGFAGMAKIDPFLEYGRRLQTMGRPMEDLTDEAKKLSDMFGISMSDAIDHIARVKMRELDREFNLFMENLLAKKAEVMGAHRVPTDFGSGTGGGLPPGFGEDTAFSIGVEAIMAGKNPTVVVQAWLDGKQQDSNLAEQEARNRDTNSGGT